MENDTLCDNCGCVVRDRLNTLGKKIFCDSQCMGDYLDYQDVRQTVYDDFDYTPDCDLYHEC